MSGIPPISSSISDALQGGFALLNQGAAQVVSATQDSPRPADTVEISTGSPIEAEPMLAGIRDMMLARVQAGAGAELLHAYNDDRRDLFDMLK